VADLERILTAARDLHAMVDRLLDKELTETLFEGADEAAAQQKLRHDLRTPINAIKGYGEMLLEDLEELGAGRMRADFDILLDQADQLLSQIDTIVDFSRSGSGAPAASPCSPAEAAAMFAGLVESIRPVGEAEAKKVETGNILVVDDMEANRTLLSRRLTRDGHRVTTAEGGRQALGLLEIDDFDLVLLDLMMPEMNGFEVLARIKADPRLHQIPVIMISALDEVDSVVRCIEAGARQETLARTRAALSRSLGGREGEVRAAAAQHPAAADYRTPERWRDHHRRPLRRRLGTVLRSGRLHRDFLRARADRAGVLSQRTVLRLRRHRPRARRREDQDDR
jgi:CheY-like chemotaxis protein